MRSSLDELSEYPASILDGFPSRTPYPSDVSDEEWEFVAPYLTLQPPDAPQRKHELREVFKAVRWLARRGRLALNYERLPEMLVQGK